MSNCAEKDVIFSIYMPKKSWGNYRKWARDDIIFVVILIMERKQRKKKTWKWL